METIKQSPETYFKSIRIIYFALLGGVIMFTLVVSGLIISGNAINSGDLPGFFQYLAPIVVVLTIPASVFVSNMKLAKLKQLNQLTDKLFAYREMFIVRFALLEGGAFFAIVISMLTGALINLSYALISILAFLFFMPNKDRIIADMELSREEKEILNNPDTVLEFKK